MKLTLFNSITRKREVFTPIDTNLVKMYVCGPTVYDHPHIGNARSVVVYDILFRTLNYIYGKDNVRYVRNITDIDDKIIDKAKSNNISIEKLTKTTTGYFHHDMDYLTCLRPSIEPKATEHIDSMLLIIEKLLDKNIAYISNEHVYFDISKAKDYYKLSGRSFEDSIEEVRINSSEGKKNAGDFVLWKPHKSGDPESCKYNSPFGHGRPGWHIECSAMSYKFLGATFDIHGGGIDLIFPHHTNEVAQTCCAFEGEKYAKTWVHNGFLTVNHEKMSKSLNNFVTVQDLINQNIHGDIIRLFLISNNYRKPLDYNDKAIEDTKKTLDYWYRSIKEADLDIDSSQTHNPTSEFINAICDDLNTANAIKIINDYAKNVFSSQALDDKRSFALKIIACASFIGLMNRTIEEWFKNGVDVKLIEDKIKSRQVAKANKDWDKADIIRKELLELGIEIEDSRDGVCTWRKK